LVVRLSSLGDVVLTTGPLRLLRERRPELAIDCLTRAAYAPALRGVPGIARVLVEEDGPASVPERSYACVLDWQQGAKAALAAARFAPGVRRVGYPRAVLHRRLLVALGRGRVCPPQPYVARLAHSVSGAWIETTRLRPRATVDPERARRWGTWLNGLGSPPHGWVALAPGASRVMKEIPRGLADAVGERCRRAGHGVLRIVPPRARTPGAPSDHPEARTAGPGEAEFNGPLEDLIALLASVRLLIGSDSGVLHLATAVGTPALCLYGCTAPELGFSPLGNAVAVGVDLPCRPCHVHGANRCWLGHRRCWTDQSPDRIWEAAAACLARADAMA
jgi:heptosyltransferase-2